MFSFTMLLMPLYVFGGNLSYPMLKEGRSWVYEYHDFDEEIVFDHDEKVFDVSYTIHGDTVIGGMTYVKLMRQQDGVSTYYAAMREEGTAVFGVRAGKSNEYKALEFDPTKLSSMPEIYGDYTERKELIKVNGREFIRHVYEPVDEYSGNPVLIGVEGIGFWGTGLVQGVYNVLPNSQCDYESFKACYEDGVCIFTNEDFRVPAYKPEDGRKCATPTITYANGKLVFSCETEDAECVYEIKCADDGSGRGGEVSLGRTYEIRVHATLDGWQDSDVAVATIGWRNGRPVMEGFSSVTLDGDGSCDVNGDGTVDVADIAKMIDRMAK